MKVERVFGLDVEVPNPSKGRAGNLTPHPKNLKAQKSFINPKAPAALHTTPDSNEEFSRPLRMPPWNCWMPRTNQSHARWLQGTPRFST